MKQEDKLDLIPGNINPWLFSDTEFIIDQIRHLADEYIVGLQTELSLSRGQKKHNCVWLIVFVHKSGQPSVQQTTPAMSVCVVYKGGLFLWQIPLPGYVRKSSPRSTYVCMIIQAWFSGSFMGAWHEIGSRIPLKLLHSVLSPTIFPFKEACSVIAFISKMSSAWKKTWKNVFADYL